MTGVLRRLGLGLLLAAPLLVFSAWVIHGAVHRSHGPTASGGLLRGLPPPQEDLPGGRLEDRLNGAAEAFRALGCRRLLYWRLTDPTSELELLVFRTPDGAREAMRNEAGPERTPGPGEEAQASAQALYFRRGALLVRLLAAPGTSPDALARQAADVDRALQAGGRL